MWIVENQAISLTTRNIHGVLRSASNKANTRGVPQQMQQGWDVNRVNVSAGTKTHGHQQDEASMSHLLALSANIDRRRLGGGGDGPLILMILELLTCFVDKEDGIRRTHTAQNLEAIYAVDSW